MQIKKVLLKIVLAKTLFFLVASSASGYWEWTPETGRWINPRYAVMDTPEEQFRIAEELRTKGRIKDSIREHRKLMKHFAGTEYAPMSAFKLGEIHRDMGDNSRAFSYYQQLIDRYPHSPLVADALKRQFHIAGNNIQDSATGFLFFRPRQAKRGDMLLRVIENHPHSSEAFEKKVMLGKFYMDIGDNEKAREMFMRASEAAVGIESRERADFYLVKAEFLSVPEVSTDTSKFSSVRRRINDFFLFYPSDSAYAAELREIKEKLSNAEAAKYFEIAAYYERAGRSRAALHYYRILAENYPETEYGKTASSKIDSDR